VRFYRRSRRRSSRGHVRMEPATPWNEYAIWGAGLGVAIILLLVVVTRLIAPLFDEDDQITHNRTWLEYEWTRGPVNRDAVVDRVYVESSAWLTDGTLIQGEYAADFSQALREAHPAIEVLLWIRMSGEQVTNADQRVAVTALARTSVREWGFDGVQLNGYGVANESESFVQLVRALRSAIGTNALLSVTVPPDRIPADPDVPVGTTVDPNLTWDLDYKQRVGLLDVDELVVMAHASGLENAVEYETWVSYQVVSYAEAIGVLDRPAELIIALPTYESAPEHDPAVEDVRAAARGVKAGLKQAGKASGLVVGVGLFEYKTTDSLEWATYAEYWLGRK